MDLIALKVALAAYLSNSEFPAEGLKTFYEMHGIPCPFGDWEEFETDSEESYSVTTGVVIDAPTVA